MTTTLWITVDGRPAPQGSKRLLGHGALVESSKRVAPWRADVRAATADALATTDDWPQPCTGPVRADLTFRFPRPKSHWRTGKHADQLRPDAPVYVTSRGCGDLSKLIRSTEDALVSAGAIADDALIVSVAAVKEYGGMPGALIVLRTVAS